MLPSAMPIKGATLLISGPCWRSVSSSVALNTAVAIPVAKPCRTRALISQPTLSAWINSSIATMFSSTAVKMTGLRPRWSDSDPTVSNATSRLRAYTAKTSVRIAAENCSCSWYRWYNGVGAVEAARKLSKVIARNHRLARFE